MLSVDQARVHKHTHIYVYIIYIYSTLYICIYIYIYMNTVYSILYIPKIKKMIVICAI